MTLTKDFVMAAQALETPNIQEAHLKFTPNTRYSVDRVNTGRARDSGSYRHFTWASSVDFE